MEDKVTHEEAAAYLAEKFGRRAIDSILLLRNQHRIDNGELVYGVNLWQAIQALINRANIRNEVVVDTINGHEMTVHPGSTVIDQLRIMNEYFNKGD